jgi:hypothetical protein
VEPVVCGSRRFETVLAATPVVLAACRGQRARKVLVYAAALDGGRGETGLRRRQRTGLACGESGDAGRNSQLGTHISPGEGKRLSMGRHTQHTVAHALTVLHSSPVAFQ